MFIDTLKVATLTQYTKTLGFNSHDSSPHKIGDYRFLSFMNKKNRSCFEIIASMLEALKGRSLLQFSLMKHTNISYAQFKKYLKALSEIGLIETTEQEDRVVYTASEKGLAFLRQYYTLRDMLLSPHSEIPSISSVYGAAYNMANTHQPRITNFAVYAPTIQKRKR